MVLHPAFSQAGLDFVGDGGPDPGSLFGGAEALIVAGIGSVAIDRALPPAGQCKGRVEEISLTRRAGERGKFLLCQRQRDDPAPARPQPGRPARRRRRSTSSPGVSMTSQTARRIRRAVSVSGALLSPARLHASVVLGLAGRAGVIRHAGALLVAALLAGIRCRSPHRRAGAAQSEQHQHDDGDRSHHDLPFFARRRPGQLRALAVLSSASRNPLASFSASSLAQKCMKISRGCSSSMWLWMAVTSMPFVRSALITGFTSSATSTKSPVIAALPPPVGWKLIAVATPVGPGGTSCAPCSTTPSRRGTANW